MKLFGRKNRDRKVDSASVERAVAPGTQIHYDGKLIDRFQGHHGALVVLITKVKEMAEAARFGEAEKYLNKFRILLNEHLLEENLRLYTYLSYCLKGDPAGSELMHDMRHEMSDIGRTVTHFIKHYSEFGINQQNVVTFVEELQKITAALGDRIEREERSLYTLYLPPETIQAGQ